MSDRLKTKLKLLAHSRYVMAARGVMHRIGLKYVRMVVYELALDTEIPKVETNVPVEIRVVSVDDVINRRYQGIRLASGDDANQHDETLRRLRIGDVCHVAILDNRVAGFAWSCFQKRKYEPAIEREESFAPTEALLYDRYVDAEFRRKGIGKKLNVERLHFLKARGFLRGKGYIESDNVPSLRSFEALGFHPVKVITCVRVLGFKWIKERSTDDTNVQEKQASTTGGK